MIWKPLSENGLADWSSIKLMDQDTVQDLFKGISDDNSSYKQVLVTKTMNLISALKKQG